MNRKIDMGLAYGNVIIGGFMGASIISFAVSVVAHTAGYMMNPGVAMLLGAVIGVITVGFARGWRSSE